MKVKESKIIFEARQTKTNPRNSEGSFIKLKDGNILFAYSRFLGGTVDDDAPCTIGAIVLDPTGEKVIKEPYQLVHGKEYDVSNVMSVSLTEMNNGDVGLLFGAKAETKEDCFGRVHRYAHFILRTSSDGYSFPKESDVLVIPSPDYSVIANDRMIKLKSGRIICATYFLKVWKNEGKSFIEERTTCSAIYSDDDGKTWKKSYNSCSIPEYMRSVTGVQESVIVEMPNGVLRMYARTDLGSQWECSSYDEGETWTAMMPSPFSSPCSPMMIKKNPYSKKLYAVWNPIPNYAGRVEGFYFMGRTPLVLAESDENGHFINEKARCSVDDFSIKSIEPIETDEEKGYAYPAIHFIDEKTMLIAYGESIKLYGGTQDLIIRKITLE